MSKQVINVAFVGGGKGCYDILRLLKSYSPAYLHTHIIGVADPHKDAIGRRHAERLGIPTQSDYKSFLQSKELDLIIELTGDDNVLADIRQKKLDSIKILDHVGALFLWEIIAIQDEKLHLEKKVSQLLVQYLDRYERPKKIVFKKPFKRTETGKIIRQV